MLAHIYKRRRNYKGKSTPSICYYARYRLEGDFVVKTVALKTTDKQVAEARLLEIIKEAERERAGLIAPKLERVSAKQKLAEHLEDFLSDLKTLGRSKVYLRLVRSRILKIDKECGWTYPGQINPNHFVAWRSKQTKLGPKTLNDYLNSICAFLNWMVRQGRISKNPLQNITRVNIKGRQQLRRAFTDDEFKRLIEVADKQRLLYLTAAYTGLRLGELGQLVWADLNLTDKRPHMLVRASTTKNKKKATLPIHPELLTELVKAKPEGVLPEQPVFDGTHHAVCARRFASDLEKAKIVRIDSLNRKLDFHSLRYTFATLLARSGVSQRLTQELMRHSDPRLTANIYTDVTCLPTFEAVHELPWLGEESDEGEGEPNLAIEGKLGTQIRTQKGVLSDHFESEPVARASRIPSEQPLDNQELWQDFSPSDTDCQMAEREGFEPSVPG